MVISSRVGRQNVHVPQHFNSFNGGGIGSCTGAGTTNSFNGWSDGSVGCPPAMSRVSVGSNGSIAGIGSIALARAMTFSNGSTRTDLLAT